MAAADSLDSHPGTAGPAIPSDRFVSVLRARRVIPTPGPQYLERGREQLAEGVRFERRLFHATFATEDQREGMAAFIAKRKPAFKNR